MRLRPLHSSQVPRCTIKGLFVFLLAAASLLRSAVAEPPYVPGDVLIKIKEELPVAPQPGPSRTNKLPPDQKAAAILSKRISKLSKLFNARREDGTPAVAAQASALALWQKAALIDLNEDPYAICRELLAARAVEECQPNFIYTAEEVPAIPGDTYLYPRGALQPSVGSLSGVSQAYPAMWGYPDMWGLIALKAVEAWNSKGSRCASCMGEGAVVAVVDSGVNASHVDIGANVYPVGYDARTGYNMTDDLAGHGTHVAGTIAAVQNGAGIAGIAPRARLMAVRALYPNLFNQLQGTSGELANSILFAAMNGASVINNSWILGDANPATGDAVVIEAIRSAYRMGVTVVVAAGNAKPGVEILPTSGSVVNLSEVISVAALDAPPADAQRASISNYGANVTVAAPGMAILSLRAPGMNSTPPERLVPPYNSSAQYRWANGTSMAAPHVAGVCALLKARAPALTPAQIKQILVASADEMPGAGVGAGRINALAAVQALDDLDLLPRVTGRYVFYKNSLYDGVYRSTVCPKLLQVSACGENTAIAPDKAALVAVPGVPTKASFSNYTSYDKGINGVIVDVKNIPADLLSADVFEFKVSADKAGTTWVDLPSVANPQIRFLPVEANGTIRAIITFADKSILNRWLQVRLKAVSPSGVMRLPSDDVFYFGNAMGDTGENNPDPHIVIDGADETAVWTHPMLLPNKAAGLQTPWDFNRDGMVNLTDALIARNNPADTMTSLQLMVVPPG